MGFKVCNLARVPSGNYKYYFYLAGRPSVRQLTWLKRNFSRLAEEIGPDAAIVQGHDFRLSDDLHKILEMYGVPNAHQLFEGMVCAVISEGEIMKPRGRIYVLPLATGGHAVDEVQEFSEELMNRLIDSIRVGKVEALLQELGSSVISLDKPDRSVLLATFRKANEIIQLNPSLAGIGLNLNAVISGILDRFERRKQL